MKRHNKGNVSVVLLVIVLVLLLTGQLTMIYLNNEYEKQVKYINGAQLRNLCLTAAEKISGQKLLPGQHQWLNAKIYPGNSEVILYSKTMYNAEQTIRYLEVCAENNTDAYKLRQVSFTPDSSIGKLAQSYGVIAGKEVTGREFLPAGTAYTSNGEVKVPAIYDFERWSINELPMNTINLLGLCRRFYYVEDYQGINFNYGMEILGSGLIAAEGSIVINSDCRFQQPVVLISARKIIIEDNVSLPDCFLVAASDIEVGSNCSISGVLVSKGNIKFYGPVDFSFNPAAAKGFTSIFFII